MEAAEVVGRQILEALDLAGQQPPPEGAVGEKADAQLPARGEHVVLGIPGPEGVLGLHRRQRMDRMRLPQRRGAGLREADVAHLARLHEVGHGSHALLDRRLRIDSVSSVGP
jgi:hypothetical protein